MPTDRSLIWTISHQDHSHFLIGTAHVQNPEILRIVRTAEELMTQVGTFYAETDLDALKMFQPPFMGSISEHMSVARYGRISSMLERTLDINLISYDHIPPLLIIQVITNKLLNSSGLSMDELLWKRAKSHNLSVMGIESSDDQLNTLWSLPFEWQMEQLKEACSNLRQFRKKLLKIMRWYQEGEILKLERSSRSDLGPMRQLLLVDRNRNMTATMAEAIQNADAPILFSMGAAHLAGFHGVLRLLRLEGFTVKSAEHVDGGKNGMT